MQRKEEYLRIFRKIDKPFFPIEKDEMLMVKKIIQIMQKEGLTHEEAYASLRYTNNLIHFEGNCL